MSSLSAHRLVTLVLVTGMFLASACVDREYVYRKALDENKDRQYAVLHDQASSAAEGAQATEAVLSSGDPAIHAHPVVNRAREINRSVLAYLPPVPSPAAVEIHDRVVSESLDKPSAFAAEHLERARVLADNARKLVNDRHRLQQDLAEELERKKQDYKRQASRIQMEHELVKNLLYIFAGASVLCVIAAVVMIKLGMGKSAFSLFAAAGIFGLAAYYVTQTWFAYIAGGFAVVLALGVIVVVVARWRQHRVLNRVSHLAKEDPELSAKLNKSLTEKEKKILEKEGRP